MKYMKNKKIWITSLRGLKEWWFRRGGIEIRYESRSKRRIAVEVSNPKNQDTENFVVHIDLNKPIKNIEITSDIINTEIPDYQFDSTNFILYLHINNLAPGETRSYFVDFENIDE
jgi:hypothetical protein